MSGLGIQLGGRQALWKRAIRTAYTSDYSDRYNLQSPQLSRRYEPWVEIVAEQEQEFLARLYQYLGMGLIITL
jgi:hypothetical protein